jgi:UDP-N-acetylglucosamine acyltransferase
MANIHPTAIVEDGAELHPSVRVGPYCIIEAGAVLGADCVLDSQVRIYAATRMGRGNRVCHGATLGSEPQDLSYGPEKGKPLVIGDDNHFKECVNISRGVKTGGGTHIGSHNYFMAFSHVGHDCQVGDHNILANTATLAGHVNLAHHIFVSGQVAVHQFCRIGPYVMIGGISGVAQDVPPYLMVNGQRARIIGLNTVGLRRNGFTQAQRNAIKQAYKVLYRCGSRQEALARLRLDDSAEIREIVAFVEGSERGLVAYVRD